MKEMEQKGILKEVDGAKVVWFDEWETPLIVQKKFFFPFIFCFFFYFYFLIHIYNSFFIIIAISSLSLFSTPYDFRDGGYLYSTTDLAAGLKRREQKKTKTK